MARKVVDSINNPTGDHCVDIFVRDDGSFGFEEFRRDHEDQRGWFSLQRYSTQRFASLDAAVAQARLSVAWFADLRRHLQGPVADIDRMRPADVVIFDGMCNLCAHSVKFILAHESEPMLRFVPLQSAAGGRMMRQLGFSTDDVKTFVLVVDGRPHVRSEAAIMVSRYLRGGWRALAALRIIPRPIRDWGYDLVARNRYRWFGRAESCMVPTADVRARFDVE